MKETKRKNRKNSFNFPAWGWIEILRLEVNRMARKKKIGIALLIIGIVVLIISVAADAIGLGWNPGFGYKQTAGTAAGAIAAIVGAILMRRK